MMMAIGLSQYNVALMHTVNHAFFKALLFLGAGINVLAINPAIFWKLLYKSIIKVLQTGQSKGNLIYKILEILRGHTQEVIIIIFFFLDFNNSSSFDINSSVLLINNLNLSFISSTGRGPTILPLLPHRLNTIVKSGRGDSSGWNKNEKPIAHNTLGTATPGDAATAATSLSKRGVPYSHPPLSNKQWVTKATPCLIGGLRIMKGTGNGHQASCYYSLFRRCHPLGALAAQTKRLYAYLASNKAQADLINKKENSFITINQNFSSYLAGLFEGEGCIWIPTNERDKNNKLIYPIITLGFNSKDFPLISIIQERLDIGHIYKVKGKNAYTYKVSNLINLFKFINIINGKLRTPKIYKLNNLIDYLNNKGFVINKYPLDITPLNSNAWLSGFIEAEGHFSVRVSQHAPASLGLGLGTAHLKEEKDKKNIIKRISCSLEISQSQRIIDLYGNNNFLVLSLISKYLLSKVKETKSNSKNPQHRIRTTSLAGNIVLKNYLLKYPLFSSKYLDSKDWMEVLNYFENKEHKKKYTEIIQIKSSMNDKRTFFHWNHLKNFYKLHN